MCPGAARQPCGPQTGDRGRLSITVADLGEFALIAAIRALLPPGGDDVVGNGDDAAVVRAPDGRMVATTDLLVEGRHFRRDWSGAFDIGCKAAAQNLADVAAMGASPTALLVGFATPGDLAVAWAEDLARGIAEECERAGAHVAGGDVSGADSVMIAITALGDLGGREPVTRGGARPGDRLAIAGSLGRSAAGLALLEAGFAGAGVGGTGAGVGGTGAGVGGTGAGVGGTGAGVGGTGAGVGGTGAGAGLRRAGGRVGGPGPAGTQDAETQEPAGLDGLVASHRRPRPPYPCGPEAADLGATSMIDISDGLLADLRHMADASEVLIDVETTRVPVDPALPEAAGVLGADWLGWILAGGEDHALAATFPAGTALPRRWRVIGTVREGRGVTVDSRPAEGRGGWDHFPRATKSR